MTADPRDPAIAEAAAEATAEILPGDLLDADEVRRRAAGGAAVLGARNVVALISGVIANLILARLLVPSDFGYVALGQTLGLVGTFLASGGLGFALVGREQPPTRLELQAVMGFQLTVSTVVAVVFAA